MKFRVKARQIRPGWRPARSSSTPDCTSANADEQTAAQLHGLTAGLSDGQEPGPGDFLKLVSTSEIALGTALLLPIVPGLLAGAGLVAFSAGCSGCTCAPRACARRAASSPTPQGTPIAKDVWMLGAGLGLVVDALTDRPASPDPVAVPGLRCRSRRSPCRWSAVPGR